MDANNQGVPPPPPVQPGGTGDANVQLLQQMFTQMMEQNRLLAEQNRQLMERLDAQPMVPPQSSGSSVKPTPPAEFSGAAGAGYEAWKERLAEWKVTHYNADPKQRAGLLMQALKGDAAALARDAVPTEQLQQPDAFDRIVAALDVHYGLRASTRQLKAFLELMRHANTGGNLEAFVRQWTVKVASLRQEGLTLPDTLRAFMMLE